MSGYPLPVEIIKTNITGAGTVYRAFSLAKTERRIILGFNHDRAELLQIFPNAFQRDKHGFLEPAL
jgi:hypothetical protein